MKPVVSPHPGTHCPTPDTSPRSEPIAIIGIGCLFPKADHLSAYWANIVNRVDAVTDVPETHWQAENYCGEACEAPERVRSSRGGFLTPLEFNPMEFGIPPNAIEAIDTSQLLGLVVTQQALRDAGYGPDRTFDRDRVSVLLGVTGTLELVIPLGARLGHPIWRKSLKEAGVEDDVAEKVVRKISESYVSWQENSFPGLLGNVVAGRIAKFFDFGGTNCIVDAACASSLSALHLATMELASGRSDMVISGGIDTFNDIFMFTCFNETQALSPSGDARPFDVRADGTILGEGLGILVLKRLQDARHDGDRIYAVIRSIGTSSDGKGQAIYAPSPAGQIKALQRAYRLADITPDTIELIEAHGTGTKAGDAAELSALAEVYGSCHNQQEERSLAPCALRLTPQPRCALGSVKSQIGHTKAAAGVAGIIKAAMALYHKVLPPTIKVTQPQGILAEARSPFYVNLEKRPWMPQASHPRRAAVSAFGFGGSNFHCVLEEYRTEKPEIDWDGQVQILAFSAKTGEEIRNLLKSWPTVLSWNELRRRAAELRAAFRTEHPYRLVAVIEQDRTDMARVFAGVRTMLERYPEKPFWSTPDGAYFGTGTPRGKLGVIFPGQGSQYVGMLRDLACHFPRMQQVLAETDRVFLEDTKGENCKRLTDFIYPPYTFSEEVRASNERALRATQIAQPAIGAVSFGALKVLDAFGIRPEAVAGHSYGELPALCVSGRINAKALYSLSLLRGQLMAEGNGHGDDRGAMLAAQAPLCTVETILREENLDLVIANKNAPNQAVLSGVTEQIEKAARVLSMKEIRNKRLPVSAAFHSSLVAHVQKPFLSALQATEFFENHIPVFANSTAGPYPADPDEARRVLAAQLINPVEFIEQIGNMYQFGIRTFLEVGPGAKLTGLVKAILEGQEHEALSIDASSGKHSGLFDLACTLAHLAAQGYGVNLALWDAGFSSRSSEADRKKPAMTIPLCGANYMKPKSPERREAEGVRSEVRSSSPSQIDPSPEKSSVSLSKRISSDWASLTEALKMTQENMLGLQKLQEQTAQLHRQFLDGQDTAQRTFQMLVEQQQKIFFGLQTSGSEAQPFVEAVRPIADIPSARIFDQKSPNPEVRIPEPETKPQATDFRVEERMQAVRCEARDAEMPVCRTPSVVRQTAGSRLSPRVEAVLLEVVSDKTGYPAEMLEMNMELDSDLGIDSIKRVEILSVLQEKLPEAPVIRPEHLGTLKTLGQIVEFLSADDHEAPDSVPPTPEAKNPEPQIRSRHSDSERIRSILLEVVSDKTGYPTEMLEMGMELDSDLGIDSIKRVEILSVLQEKLPEAPVIKPEHLGTLKTLGQIVEFLSARGHEVPGSGGLAPKAKTGIQRAESDFDRVAAVLLEVVSDKTGYPTEMLEMDMELDSDLGIDSIKRVEILSVLQEKLPEAPVIKPEHLGTLKTLRHITEFLSVPSTPPRVESSASHAESPAVSEAAPPSRPGARDAAPERYVLTEVKLDENSVRQIVFLPKGSRIWITAHSRLAGSLKERLESLGYRPELVSFEISDNLEHPSDLGGLVILSPDENPEDSFLKDSFRLVRFAGPGLRNASRNGGSVLVTVSCLGGFFGLKNLNEHRDPVSGGLAGLLKTAHHEWPEVHCKALDLTGDFEETEAARFIVDEMFLAEPVEVGFSRQGRHGLQLVPMPVEDFSRLESGRTGSGFPLEAGDVVVMTGGARGVTAEAAVALSKAFHPTLVLLGRSKEPGPEADWLASLTGETEIKKALLSHAGGKASPKQIEERYRAILANREVLHNMARIEAAGSKSIYRSLDVRDEKQVQSVIREIRDRVGPVRGLIHGAGVLADRLIEDKTEEQFEQVYSTKVGGFRNLLKALESDDLRVMVLFSSSTARYGRTGQADYAVANEVLNKLGQQQAKLRPHCRVVSVNWGPWAGGMVTPSLRKVFEKENVGLIDLEAGAEYLVQEICSGSDRPVEVVVLGKTAEIKHEENMIGAGLKPAPTVPLTLCSNDSVLGSRPSLSQSFERQLDIETHPFLKSHVMNGRAVLPAAMIIEWMAHGALHRNPGLKFTGFNDLRILKGVILQEDRSCTVRLMTGKPVKQDGMRLVPVELCGSGGNGSGDCVHARAEIVLSTKFPEGDQSVRELPLRPYSHRISEIYDNGLLFHGPHFQGIEEVEGCSEHGIVAMVCTAPIPGEWIGKPLRHNWLTDPLVLDCAFQMMILWSFEKNGVGSLPCFAGRYRQFQPVFPKGKVRVVVRVTKDTPHRAHADIEFFNPLTGKLIAFISDYECVMDASLNSAFQSNRLIRQNDMEVPSEI